MFHKFTDQCFLYGVIWPLFNELLNFCVKQKMGTNSCRLCPWQARGCYRDVCVKSCHLRAAWHMEGVRAEEAEEAVEEEEERKSLVSSTHLSSSERSAAAIGKPSQCWLLASSLTMYGTDFRRVAMAAWQLPLLPVATVSGQSQRRGRKHRIRCRC